MAGEEKNFTEVAVKVTFHLSTPDSKPDLGRVLDIIQPAVTAALSEAAAKHGMAMTNPVVTASSQ